MLDRPIVDTGERIIPDLIVGSDWISTKLLEQHLARYEHAARAARDRDVLDLACGAGFGAAMLADAGARQVVGLDNDPQIVAYASRRYGAPRVVFACGQSDDLDPASYDLVTSFETLEHVVDPAAFLRNVTAALRPGGRLHLSATVVETRDLYRFHLHDFTAGQLRDLVRAAGLRPIDEFEQTFSATARQVRHSMRARPVAPDLRRLLRRPLRSAGRLLSACVFEGLEYRNLTIVAAKR